MNDELAIRISSMVNELLGLLSQVGAENPGAVVVETVGVITAVQRNICDTKGTPVCDTEQPYLRYESVGHISTLEICYGKAVR